MDIHEILFSKEIAAGAITLAQSKRPKETVRQASFPTDSIPDRRLGCSAVLRRPPAEPE
jgi:hypothetical protein